MKTIESLRDYLLANYVNEDGDLNISGLDFSEFDGDVVINGMKVKRDLYHSYYEVRGDLFQDGHEVKGDLFQGYHAAKGNLYQSEQSVQGSLFNEDNVYGGELYEKPSTKTTK